METDGEEAGSVADPDPVGSGPFSPSWIRSNFPNPDPVPDPTIKSHITKSKSNKLNRYFCEKFTFFIIKPANTEKEGVGGRGRGGRGLGRGGVAGVGEEGREVVVKAEKQ